MRQICAAAWHQPQFRSLLAMTGRLEGMSPSFYIQKIASNTWGRVPELEVFAHTFGFQFVVWSPQGYVVYATKPYGPRCHLGFSGRHYVALTAIGPVWWCQAALGNLSKAPWTWRGGMPRRRSSPSPAPERINLTPHVPTAKEYQQMRVDQIEAVPELPLYIEKTWLRLRQWGRGSGCSGWSLYCDLCQHHSVREWPQAQ